MQDASQAEVYKVHTQCQHKACMSDLMCMCMCVCCVAATMLARPWCPLPNQSKEEVLGQPHPFTGAKRININQALIKVLTLTSHYSQPSFPRFILCYPFPRFCTLLVTFCLPLLHFSVPFFSPLIRKSAKLIFLVVSCWFCIFLATIMSGSTLTLFYQHLIIHLFDTLFHILLLSTMPFHCSFYSAINPSRFERGGRRAVVGAERVSRKECDGGDSVEY